MIVGDIMTKDPVCVKENDLMTHARQVLRDNHLHGLPVLDENGRVVGMLDVQDVLRLQSGRSEVTVGGYAREFPFIIPQTGVREAAKLLIDAQQHRSPVLNSSTDKTIAGILSDTNLLRQVHLSKLPQKTVGEIMNKNVKTAYPDDSVAKIWGNMLEWDYTGIPVVSHDDEVIGIITRSDIIKVGFARVVTRSGDFHDNGSGDSPKVEKLMSTPLYSISSGTTISKAIEAIIHYDVGRICVTDNKHLIGIVDRFSLLKECLSGHGFE
ncbi:CBS domain-containing protein [Methanolobus psychrotolerans]|uniref:CBS domain-containing protein n=1 Tax=Methanolobus psychrotolerans TaxID=1874706 RepID=UPI001F5C375C|nr:CBS domain-containing protein [Methanolobus psychrotolerans]